MDASDLSRDTSGTRSFSQFIVEIADKMPSYVLPNISLLMSHLDGDVSTIVSKIYYCGLKVQVVYINFLLENFEHRQNLEKVGNKSGNSKIKLLPSYSLLKWICI